MLYRATGSSNRSLVEAAERVADAVVKVGSRWSPHSTLVEPCEPKCDANGRQFKGIFTRYLSYFLQAVPNSPAAPRYCEFLQHNAETLWAHDRVNSSNQFGPHWAGPIQTPDAITQTSALDALTAAIHCDAIKNS